MPRFVLLRHECPPGYVKPSHWDFMLEFEGVLWTWELRELPEAWGGAAADQALPATRLANHRIDFLEFEGLLTGDRGSVSRGLSGEFDVLHHTADRLCVRLKSHDTNFEVRLTATSQHGKWIFELVA